MNILNTQTNINNEIIENKKRKNEIKPKKKSLISSKKQHQNLLKQAYDTKLIWYIKALLQIYKTLPNVMNIIDKIIERKASSLYPTSITYGGAYINTLNQVNSVINISERKDKLLNLYVIVDEMLSCLEENERKFTILKFIQKNTSEEIASELKTSERTIFRKSNTVIEKIAIYMLKQNYTTKFLDNQIDGESWIHDIIKQKYKEDFINKRRNGKLQ